MKKDNFIRSWTAILWLVTILVLYITYVVVPKAQGLW